MAAPCPPWLKQAFIGWLGPERIWELYGGTERYGRCIIGGAEWLSHQGSVGQAKGGGQIKAIRPDGSDCLPGEVGELHFFPPQGVVQSHYVGATDRGTPSGWFSLGDLGQVDEDGYVYLADRRTDLILRGGANIYPAEVEAALDEHPAVASSLVVGLPSEDMGARVHALVQLKPGAPASLADIHAFLTTRLTTYKLPESYEVADTALRDDAGKARRSAIRDERLRWLEEGRPFRTEARTLPPS
jgi:bile acid-coenzyme A ligase